MKRFSILLVLVLLLQIFVPQSTVVACEPNINVTPLSIDFGSVPEGSMSAPHTVTVTNTGNAGLVIRLIEITGDYPNQFIITSDHSVPKVIQPGSPFTYTLVFAPTSVGYKTAKMYIFWNDRYNTPVCVTLSGTGTIVCKPDILVNPASINFGDVLVGTQSAAKNVTVTNTGTANLIIGNLTISNGQFTISGVNISGQTLVPGASANISLVFTPAHAGAQSANLTIPSNDPVKAIIDVNLSGNGIVSSISVNPTSINFGDVLVGTDSATQVVTVTNTGTANLTIGTLMIDNTLFHISSGDISGQTLAPGASANISLIFHPTATGHKTGTLTIPSNDPDHLTFDVGLEGNGIAPEISVNPDSVNFNNVPLNTQSGAKTVTVTNIGTADLTILNLTISDGQFALASTGDNISGQALVPGASANISLTFHPTATGPQSANLTITSNDLNHSPLDVPLYGNATVALISVEPDSINFDDVLIGENSTTRIVMVTNTGTADLIIGVLTIDNSQFYISIGNISGQTLVPGASANISLIFHPTATGPKSGTLTIPSNDPINTTFDVDLTGNGIAPEISVSPTSIKFGDVLVGTDSETKTVTVKNEGTANLTIGTLTIDNALFFISSGNISGQTLTPGASADISLIFHPTATGPQSGNLTIPSNDPDESTIDVALTGNGIIPDISVAPISIDFGDVLVNSTSAAQDVTVTNEGTADLIIGTLTISDTQFTIFSGNISGDTLIPSASANISLVFSPNAAGPQSANLTIPSNDPDESTITVALSGNGKTVPDIAVSPTSIDFGYVQVAHPSATQNVTVTNNGTAKLIIYNLVINDTQFAISSGNISGQTLAPDASANISIVFTPAFANPQSANLTITSNDPDENPVNVALSGIGSAGPVAPDITVTPLSVPFGDVLVGSNSTAKDVTVTNNGTANLYIGTLAINDSQFSISSGDISGATLGPGASANISLVFKPTATGPQSANLTIPSNDPDESTVTVALSGNGFVITADLMITKTDSLDPVVFGDNFTYTLKVTNSGPDGATGVKVTDTLPVYVNYISANASTGNATYSSGNVTWDIGSLANTANATLDIVVTLNPLGVMTGGSFTNTAVVSGNEYDPDNINSSASQTTTIRSTDLEITKTDFPDPIGLGDNVTWVVTVTNKGTENASNVVVIDAYVSAYTTINGTTTSNGTIITTLPQWLIDFASQAGLPIFTPPTGVSLLYWDIGDLPSGASVNMTVDASANFSLPLPPNMLNLLALMGSGTLPNFILPNGAIVLSPLGDSDFNNNIAYTTTAIDLGFPHSDLAITKTGTPDPVAPGDNITYTITIQNKGPENATGVFVLDGWLNSQLTLQSALPSAGTANTTLPSWLSDVLNQNGPPPADFGYLFWDVGDLASGASANLTITATANAAISYLASIVNYAVVSGPVLDENPSNNYAWTYTSIAQADLEITKMDNPDPVATSGNLTYTLTVTNNGPDDAAGVTVNDALPAGVTYQSATPSTGNATHSSGNVTWDIGNLNNGASANLTILVTAPSSTGNITNTATVSGIYPDPVPGNNSATTTTTVALSTDADLAITKTDSPDPVATSDNLTYILTVTNNGPANATGVIVTDMLPATATYVSNTGTATYASGNVTWNIGTLDYGASANLTILVKAPSTTGTITNTTKVTSDNDPVAGNNDATADTFVAPSDSADLAITKSDSPDPVGTGGDLTYTLTVTNNGPADATEIIVTDALPDTVTYVSNNGTATYASGNVTWNIDSLNVRDSATLTIVVTAPLTTGTITNKASVIGHENDPITANNSASETTNVNYVPIFTDLQIIKNDVPDPVITGNNLTYTVTVTNDGPDNASGVIVTDTLPATTTYVSDTPSTGSTSQASGNITWNIGNLDYGASATLTIVVIAPPSTSVIINSANVTGNEIDIMLENNMAVASTFVLPGGDLPDITVVPTSLDFGSVVLNTPSAGQNITVTNNGTVNLIIGNLTINNRQFTIASDNISGQTLAPDASAIISLIFTPAAEGLQLASLSITSNDPDENPVNVALSGYGTTPSPPPEPPPGPPEPTPTPTPPPPPPPEPTPTPTPTPETLYFTVDFLGKITQEVATSDGRPVANMAAPSPDGLHLLEIEALTGASVNETQVTLLEIREAQAPQLPENTQLVGKAYEFKPSGTVFDKPIKLTLGYNVNDLPDQVISVGAAYYTSQDGWTYLDTESTSVAELGKLTASINHFTIFAVLAKVPPSQPSPNPALFNLSNLSITTSVHRIFEKLTYVIRTGEDAVISADVTNDGGQSGTYTAILVINGTERERKDITLQPGQTGTVSFTVTGNDKGTYTVLIGTLSGDFLSDLWINWWLIVATIVVIILIIWLIWYIIKRRKQREAPTTNQ